ncbi:MAG TPA: hypothetical protein VIL32_00365, partial [Steroidobacteraceae bacterium]
CLIGFVRGYMDALKHRDPSRVRFARNVRFTENNVEMPLGNDGLWATVTDVAPSGLEAADTTTGEAAWIGTVEEHGLPVYYGMRLQVRNRAITEVETVVVRTTGLPLPFADPKNLVHDPSFAEILPPEERRPRERLRAVADSYFNTVELNDGVVFAPFDPECGRLENGILTTAPRTGSSGDVAQGCEPQLRLGLYRINKRIRERRYPIIDVERGVVVATGFFDHANEFDRYRTTDGREMRTLLKWPNSISLVEAFKIRNGRIYRIEAVFTYVPYFMHSPFYEYPPLPEQEERRRPAPDCDRDCLIAIADQYMEAMVKQQPNSLPWAEEVRHTENSVSINVGEGQWGSIRGKSDTALRIADPETGTVVWYGLAYDHDAPAYFGVRLRVEGKRIADVEMFAARERNPGPWGDPSKFRIDPLFTTPVPADKRLSRERLVALVEGYANSVQQNDGTLFTQFHRNCERIENGMPVTSGEGASAVIVKGAAKLARGCEAQLKLGLYRPVDRVRDRRIAVVDPELGIVVATSYADYSVRTTRYTTTDGKTRETQDRYPSTRELFEIFKIEGGRIRRIEAVSVFQPYRMPSPWVN